VKCLAPTVCKAVIPSLPPALALTECAACHALGPTPGQVRITYDMYGIPDRLDCFYRGVLVASTGGLVSGTGTLQWAYAPAPGDPAVCLIVMSAPNSGTAWIYTMHCPTP